MSMHEFEDVVEGSVVVIDRACESGKALDARSMFAGLYAFQDLWDTSFTHFRVMEVLLKHRFVYRFEYSDHPEYERYRTHLEAIDDDSDSFVHVDPSAEGDEVKNPIAGYVDEGKLFCDAGSLLWKAFVDAGRLTGADAVPPTRLELLDIVDTIVALAEEQKDEELLSIWYPLVAASICNPTGATITPATFEAAALIADPRLVRIRATMVRTGACRMDHGYGMTRLPKKGKPSSLDRFHLPTLAASTSGGFVAKAFTLLSGPPREVSKFLRWWFEPIL